MKNLFTYMLMFVAATGFSQQLPLYSQYYNNPMLINPGFTGSSENIEANVIHRNQWKSIPGAPVTSVLSVDGATNDEKVGLGLIVMDDKMGLFARRGIYTSYSYSIKVAPDQYVRPGISFGLQDVMVDFSKANISDNNDPNLYTTTQRKSSFDANFGVAYTWKELKAGVSVMQLFGNKFKLNNDTGSYYRSTQKINVYGSYVVPISKDNKINARPCLALNINPQGPFQADVFANFDYADLIFAGVGYRSNSTVSFNLGLKWNHALRVSYNYDMVVGKLKGYTGGSHEIMLGYSFGRGGGSSVPANDYSSNMGSGNSDSLQQQINKLKQDVTVLKAELDFQKKGDEASQVKDDLVIQYAKDYKDYNGNVPEKGFYVVLSQFKTLPQAEADKKDLATAGIESTLLMHPIKGYFVYSKMLPESAQAYDELKKIRWKRINSYVLELK